MSLWDDISIAASNEFNDLQASATTQINDFKNVGVPALVKSGASKAIEVLTKVQTDASNQVQTNVAAILARPSNPDSFWNKYIAPDLQAAGIKTYGPEIMIGVLVIGVAAVFIFGKKA